MHPSVSEIRRRLLFLLLRAFIIVLFLSLLFFTFIIGYFLTSSSISFQSLACRSGPS